MYPKQAAHLQYYLGPEIRALVNMQLSESSVPSYNFEYQFSSDSRGLLVRDREALEPFRKVAPHHKAVLVPGRSDRVGSADVRGQSFHWSLQHCTVALIADPAHVGSHSGPVETLLCQCQGACRASMGSDHSSMEPLEQTAASIRRDD